MPAVLGRDISMSDLAFLAEILIAQYHAVCSNYRVKRDFCDARSRWREGPAAG
ncbi:hypothetical protein CES86_1980 [Brucella lupini]|uniref:Uncharacterized protein n=1 Tax=Brucella lupini TaxID=255457 RepID=A0A256GT46_9HYPH|nr:hypothetical protein CES86_1980 [Brucella lupini]